MFRGEKNVQRITAENVQRIQVRASRNTVQKKCLENQMSKKSWRTLQDSLIAVAVQEINWKATLGRESVEIGND
jgi:hypothetical protein